MWYLRRLWLRGSFFCVFVSLQNVDVKRNTEDALLTVPEHVWIRFYGVRDCSRVTLNTFYCFFVRTGTPGKRWLRTAVVQRWNCTRLFLTCACEIFPSYPAAVVVLPRILHIVYKDYERKPVLWDAGLGFSTVMQIILKKWTEMYFFFKVSAKHFLFFAAVNQDIKKTVKGVDAGSSPWVSRRPGDLGGEMWSLFFGQTSLEVQFSSNRAGGGGVDQNLGQQQINKTIRFAPTWMSETKETQMFSPPHLCAKSFSQHVLFGRKTCLLTKKSWVCCCLGNKRATLWFLFKTGENKQDENSHFGSISGRIELCEDSPPRAGWCVCGGWIPAGGCRPLVSAAPRHHLCVKCAAGVNARWELLSANPRSARTSRTESDSLQASPFRTFEHTILTYLWTRDAQRWAEGAASRLGNVSFQLPWS